MPFGISCEAYPRRSRVAEAARTPETPHSPPAYWAQAHIPALQGRGAGGTCRGKGKEKRPRGRSTTSSCHQLMPAPSKL
eukprot:365480-Chlamydomonas_euryale.AAC.3